MQKKSFFLTRTVKILAILCELFWKKTHIIRSKHRKIVFQKSQTQNLKNTTLDKTHTNAPRISINQTNTHSLEMDTESVSIGSASGGAESKASTFLFKEFPTLSTSISIAKCYDDHTRNVSKGVFPKNYSRNFYTLL